MMQPARGFVFAFCLAGWGGSFGMILGFFNGCVLRYRNSSIVLSAVAGCVSFTLCCGLPGFFLYRWIKCVPLHIDVTAHPEGGHRHCR
jgi:hypothetical protein